MCTHCPRPLDNLFCVFLFIVCQCNLLEARLEKVTQSDISSNFVGLLWFAVTYMKVYFDSICSSRKTYAAAVLTTQSIRNCRNVRGLGKSMVVFRLFERLRYLDERSTKFESLYHEEKYLEEENGKMVALQISPKIKFVWIGYTGHKN